MQFSSLFILVLIADSAVATATPRATSLNHRVVSWNIRFDANRSQRGKGETPWYAPGCEINDQNTKRCRRPYVIATMRDLVKDSPTIFGLQEVLSRQIFDIKTGLGTEWAHIGDGRDDGKDAGEFTPIFYRTDQYRLVHWEQKWLSPSPDIVSFGWNSGSRRVVVTGVFEEKVTKKRFIHTNTHLDNVSELAQVEGIKVVAARIQAVQANYGPLSMTLTGDFNGLETDAAYKTLQDMSIVADTWNSGAMRNGPYNATFTGFTKSAEDKIDFVWAGPTIVPSSKVNSVEIVTNDRGGMIISDHRAIVVDMVLL